MPRLTEILREIRAGAEVFFSSPSGYHEGNTAAFLQCDSCAELLARYFVRVYSDILPTDTDDFDLARIHSMVERCSNFASRPPQEKLEIGALHSGIQIRRSQRRQYFSLAHLMQQPFTSDDCIEAFCEVFEYGSLLFREEWATALRSVDNLQTYKLLFDLEKLQNEDVRDERNNLLAACPRARSSSEKTGVYEVQAGQSLHLRLAVENERSNLRQQLQDLQARLSQSAPEVVVQTAQEVFQTMPRDQIFISYAHLDEEWLHKLKTHLKPAIAQYEAQGHQLDVWDDKRIKLGSDWLQEILTALARAKVGVMIVSPDFLASDFIRTKEVPELIKAAQNDGATIIWFVVRPCSWHRTALKDIQSAYSPKEALNSTSVDKDAALVSVCDAIVEAYEN